MKKIVIALFCLFLLSGCVNAGKKEPTRKEILQERKSYLAEAIETKCKELFPDGYTEVVRHYSMSTIEGTETAKRVVLIVQPADTEKYTAVELGPENEYLVGKKENDVFFVNEEKEPGYEEMARKDYPEITSKTDWVVIKRKGINKEAYDLIFTLEKEQLNDEALLSDILQLISADGSFEALIKDEEVKSKELLIPVTLLSMGYGLSYCPYEGEPWQHEVWLSVDSRFEEERLDQFDTKSLREKLVYQMEHK
ncbi:MAG: hypothetical protein HUJ58_00645 [Erysipelotrichaceae bacterium]|nr:hypothetical protein [Erysipelotrichaceae bacterium]